MCERHHQLVKAKLESFFIELIEVVEMLALPGVPPIENRTENPFINRSYRFLNHAAQHWAADVAAMNRAADKREKKTSSSRRAA
jgi:hypothetical protein